MLSGVISLSPSPTLHKSAKLHDCAHTVISSPGFSPFGSGSSSQPRKKLYIIPKLFTHLFVNFSHCRLALYLANRFVNLTRLGRIFETPDCAKFVFAFYNWSVSCYGSRVCYASIVSTSLTDTRIAQQLTLK